MKILDIVAILILGLGAYQGYKKGLLVELISFFALIIGIISAFKLLHTGISFLETYFGDDLGTLLPYMSFIGIFFLVFFIIHLLGKVIKASLDYTILGKLDSVAGGIFGLLKIAFGLSLMIWISHAAKITPPTDYTEGAYVYLFLIDFAPKVFYFVSNIIPFQDILPAVKHLLD